MGFLHNILDRVYKWIDDRTKTKKAPIDYCSDSPDFIGYTYIGDICKEHDKAYSKMKNLDDKLKADIALRDGITLRTNFIVGWIYYLGVRIGGGIYG